MRSLIKSSWAPRVPVQAVLGASLCLFGIACSGLQSGSPAPWLKAVSSKYEAVDQLLGDAVLEGRAAGLCVMVVRDGSVDFLQAYGEAELGSGRPMTTESIFRIYSMTKPVTSVAAMMLWEEGKIGLDDPVENYLPEWGSVEVGQYLLTGHEIVALERPITIRNLLRHTSGIPYHAWMLPPYPGLYEAEFGVGAEPDSLDEFSRRLARVPLVHQPGGMWTYGASTDVLARVIEVVAEVPFQDFVAERLLEPLGMSDTAFWVPDEKWDRFVAQHSVGEDGLVNAVKNGSWDPYRAPPSVPSGGGGLVSTLEDYAVFLQMLVEGGSWKGKRYLSESTVELMTSPEAAAGGAHPFFNHWGLGFEIISKKNESKGWGLEGGYSWSGIARTHFLVDPERDLVMLLYQQTEPFEVGFRNEVFHGFHEALGIAPESPEVE